MHADLRSWLGLLAGVSAAALAAAVGNAGTLIYLMDVHPGVAGWVQAIGSVAAIGAGFLVAGLSASEARRLARERATEDRQRIGEMEIEALLLISASMHTSVTAYCTLSESSEWHPTQADRLRRMLEGDLSFIDRLNLAAFPNRHSAGLAIQLRAFIVTLFSMIDSVDMVLAAGHQPYSHIGNDARKEANRLVLAISKVAPTHG